MGFHVFGGDGALSAFGGGGVGADAVDGVCRTGGPVDLRVARSEQRGPPPGYLPGASACGAAGPGTPSNVVTGESWIKGEPWVSSNNVSAVLYKSAERVGKKALKVDALLRGTTYTEVK